MEPGVWSEVGGCGGLAGARRLSPPGLRHGAFFGEAPWPCCGMPVARGAGAMPLAYAQGSDTTGR